MTKYNMEKKTKTQSENRECVLFVCHFTELKVKTKATVAYQKKQILLSAHKVRLALHINELS